MMPSPRRTTATSNELSSESFFRVFCRQNGGNAKLTMLMNRRRMAAYEQTSALRRKNRDALEQAIEQFMGYKEHMTDGTDRLATLLDEVAATV